MKAKFSPYLGFVLAGALALGAFAARAGEAQASSRTPAVPRIVDLGSVHCIPCKAMAPILEGLRKEYAGRLQIDFIDVWKVEGAKEQYGVRTIPTQIFYDANGRELTRHQGFIGREEILATFKKSGVDL